MGGKLFAIQRGRQSTSTSTENKAWTESKCEWRTSVDGEQAVAGLRPGIPKKKKNILICTTGVDLNERGLEQGVDLKKA